MLQLFAHANRVNEEMIETLFVSNSTRRSSKSGTKGPNSSLCSQENKVLDPKKSQVQNYLWIFFLITGRHVADNNILLETQNVLLRKHQSTIVFFYLLLKWTAAVPMTPRTMSPFSPVAFGIIALSKGLVGGEHVLMINSLYASFVVSSSGALPSEKQIV